MIVSRTWPWRSISLAPVHTQYLRDTYQTGVANLPFGRGADGATQLPTGALLRRSTPVRTMREGRFFQRATRYLEYAITQVVRKRFEKANCEIKTLAEIAQTLSGGGIFG